MPTNIRTSRSDLLYPELSYKIVGCLINAYAKTGPGHREKIYQRATALMFKNANIKFQEQVYVPIKIDDTLIGKNYLDFLIEDKIIIELKAKSTFSYYEIDQLYQYLKALGLELGLLVHFTADGVKYKRIINKY